MIRHEFVGLLGLAQPYVGERQVGQPLAQALAPADAEILNNLAVACEGNGRYEDAEKFYVQALEAGPKDRTIRDNFERFRIFYAQYLQKDLEEAKPAPSDTRAPEPS